MLSIDKSLDVDEGDIQIEIFDGDGAGTGAAVADGWSRLFDTKTVASKDHNSNKSRTGHSKKWNNLLHILWWIGNISGFLGRG